MRRHQEAVQEAAELEAAYLGLTLERTAARLLVQARQHAKRGSALELPHGTRIAWEAGKEQQMPRGFIQHDPARVAALRWLLAFKTALSADGLWKRLHNIDNYGKEWDGKPGDLVCYEDRR